jgi:hypothetical protein
MRIMTKFEPYLKQDSPFQRTNQVSSLYLALRFILILVALHTALSPNACMAAVIRNDEVKLNRMEYSIGNSDELKEDDRN